MKRSVQITNRIGGLDLWMTVAAISIAILLILAAATQVQAQTFTVLHNFTGGADGASPQAGLTMDRAGNLYGTTGSGGNSNAGTVFRFAKKNSTWLLTPLYTFGGGDDGAFPAARVIIGPDDSFYGSTVRGGLSGGCTGDGCGTIYKLQPSPVSCKTVLCYWTETVLYRFTELPDGAYPDGDLIFDQAGNIYGTTYGGGANPAGTVFELSPSGEAWTESVLHSFTGLQNQGGEPHNGVIFDPAGNLYGTVSESGATLGICCGGVFELTPSVYGWSESSLYFFQGQGDGGYPYSGVIFDSAGNLYGATTSAGSANGGTVFELTPSGGSWTQSTLYGLSGPGSDGAEVGPFARLTMDSAGNLYGTTFNDGAYNQGSIFKLTPSNGGWIYTDLHDFTGGNDGANSYSNVVIDADGNLYGTAWEGGAYSKGVIWEITP